METAVQELRLVGIADDGESLILIDAAKTRYRLVPTDALREAIRRDRRTAAEGASAAKEGSSLRPREVQGLIRAGVALEEIAERAGWTLEKVQRYEGPIRAERDYVSGLAQAVVLPSRHESTTLRERADRRLAERGVEAERVVWDSWKTDETHWTVVVRFPAGGRLREASWLFDPMNRSLRTIDDEARWLGGDEIASADVSDVAATKPPRVHREANVYDVEAEGGLDEAVQSPNLGARVGADTRPAALAESMRARQASRGRATTRTRRPAKSAAEPFDAQAAAAKPVEIVPGQDDLLSAAVEKDAPRNAVKAPATSAPKRQAAPKPAVKPTPVEPVEPDDEPELHDGPDAEVTPVADEQPKPKGRIRRRTTRRSTGPAPVRAALVPGGEDDEYDDELFDDLPGFHDGGHPVEPDIDDVDALDAGDEFDDLDAPEDDAAEADVADAEVADDDTREADSSASEPAGASAKEKAAPKGKNDRSAMLKDVPERQTHSRRAGRPSVPSWDDIMFGGGRGKK